jgi:hypothetical protein
MELYNIYKSCSTKPNRTQTFSDCHSSSCLTLTDLF